MHQEKMARFYILYQLGKRLIALNIENREQG